MPVGLSPPRAPPPLPLPGLPSSPPPHTPRSFPLGGCANAAPGLALIHCSLFLCAGRSHLLVNWTTQRGGGRQGGWGSAWQGTGAGLQSRGPGGSEHSGWALVLLWNLKARTDDPDSRNWGAQWHVAEGEGRGGAVGGRGGHGEGGRWRRVGRPRGRRTDPASPEVGSLFGALGV